MELNTPVLGIGARIKHPTFGEGVVVGMDVSTLEVFFKNEGDKQISRKFEGLKIIESPRDADAGLDLKTVENALKNVLEEMSGITFPVEMGSKWEGGTLVIKPGRPELQSKEVPIEVFFNKIIMIRDRLRVLEQNINSQNTLTNEEKIHLQQYISRAYGSLTTFNILFADKKDHFSSK